VSIALTTPRTWVAGEVPTASVLNQQIRDNSDYLNGETGWSAPALVNGWVNFGSSYNYSTVGYRKLGDMVWLKGLLKSGTVGAVMFTLPVGYRPLARCGFAIESNNAFGRVDVQPDGTVFTVLASNVFVSLDGIVFSTI
jgi:hypothetical protein